MAPKKKVKVVPLFSKLEQEYAKALLPKVSEKKEGILGLTLDEMRSFGTKTKVSPNQVKIGGVKSGLYYDKSLPFLKTKLKTKTDGNTYTHYYLRGQENKPSDILTVRSWDPIKKEKVVEKVRRDDPRLSWYTNEKGHKMATLGDYGSKSKGEEIATPLIKKIVDNPASYNVLNSKGIISSTKVMDLVNAKFIEKGHKPYTQTNSINNLLKKITGEKRKADPITQEKKTEIINFLKLNDLYKTITSPDVAKNFPGVPHYIIERLRQAEGLVRTNIGDSGSTSRVAIARRKIERMIKRKYKNLTDEQVEAVAEHARTFLQSKIHTPVQPGYGMKYTDKDIQTAFNFLNDTFLKYLPPQINEYAFERALNSLRRELTGKRYTVGHSRKDPADWWWFGGDEVAAINPQISGLNLTQFKLDSAFQSAMRKGDYDTAQKIMDEMVRKGMRSSMVDDYGELVFFGAPPRKGKLAEGGLISNPLTAMMNSGGFMDYGEMKPVVPPLDPGERQHLVKGGSKKGKPKDIFSTLSQYQARAQLPEVIGHTTKITEKLAAPKGDVVVKPWAVVDRDGLPIKDFKTEKDAEKWLYDKKETVPENEYYESTIDYSVKPVEQIKTAPVVEETPAIMWKAPEIIANAPMEIAQGKQWLGILKKAGVSPKELDDTSLAPFLEIHEPNTKFTKAQLLKEFDDLAPKIEVLTTGKRDQSKYLNSILTKFNNVRDSISDFSGKDQAVLNSFTGILQKVNAAKTDKELSVLANQTNKIMKQGYGINNALMSNQIPAIRQIPAPIRSIFGDMQELFKTRGAAHAFNKKPSHAGDQVLPGGVNYREYLFKYTPNQFRGDEPRYTPGHTFSFSDDLAQNTFVHARISDRTDNFGRKLLFVEEIQSDMHQRPQKRIRQGESSGYATRQDKIVGAEPLIKELKALQNKIDAILAREPNNSSLPALYKKRGTLADKIEKIRLEASAKGKGGDIPEGPFQRSEDYGSFVMKYLLRLAKEGNYDGVAVSTGNIKNRRGYGSEDQQKGHYGFYDKIMQKVMKKIAKNADLEYNRTVINDGAVNWGNVPILILKEIDKVMKGLPSFREGGLNRENFVDVVPLL